MSTKGQDDYDDNYKLDETMRHLSNIAVSASDLQWRNAEIGALHSIKSEIQVFRIESINRMRSLEDKKMLGHSDVALIAQREFRQTKDEVEELKDSNKWVTRGLLAAAATSLIGIGAFLATKVLH